MPRPPRADEAGALYHALNRLNRNDSPALSDKHRLLTYAQLLDEVLACKQILEDNGYGVGHRICIQGPNRVETWVWMIAASFDASGTTLPWNASEYTENARLKKNNANVVVRLNKDGTVKEFDHKHFDKATTDRDFDPLRTCILAVL